MTIGGERLFLLICFDDSSNPFPTNGKSVPIKVHLSLSGGKAWPLGKYAYGPVCGALCNSVNYCYKENKDDLMTSNNY